MFKHGTLQASTPGGCYPKSFYIIGILSRLTANITLKLKGCKGKLGRRSVVLNPSEVRLFSLPEEPTI